MFIAITGCNGFIGKNLYLNLSKIKILKFLKFQEIQKFKN